MRWGSPAPLVGEVPHEPRSGRPRSRGVEGPNRYHTLVQGAGGGQGRKPTGTRRAQGGQAGGRKEQGAHPAGKGVQRGSPPPSSADLSQRFISYSLSLGQLDSAQRSGSSPSQPSRPRTPAGRCREPQLLLPAWPASPRFSLGWQMGPGSSACGGCARLARKDRS